MATSPLTLPRESCITARARQDNAALHREQCLRRISELEAEIKAVKLSFNSVSPAYNLPPEILSNIFLHTFALTATLDDYDDEPDVGELKWMVVTQVCQRWRDVALGCAELWSTPSFVNPRIASMMLERSKQAPLTIDFNSDREERPSAYCDAVVDAVAQIHRLRSVKFVQHCQEGICVPLRESLQDWTGTAPLLEDLYLFGLESYDDLDSALPTPFLGGGAHALRRLTIIDIPCGPSLKEIRAPNLTYLRLDFPNLSDSIFSRPTTADFFGALSQFPLLEVLEVDDYLPSATDARSYRSKHPRLLLKELKQMVLMDDMDDLTAFLAPTKVHFLTTISLRINSGTEGESPDIVSSKTRTLFQEAFVQSRHGLTDPGAARPKILKFDASNTGIHRAHLDFWLWYGDDDDPTPNPSPDLRVEVSSSMISKAPILQLLWPTLDFSALSNLKLADSQDFTESEWLEMVGSLPRLKSIRVGGSTANFFKALMAVSPPGKTLHDGHVSVCKAFPGLTRVILSRRRSEDSEGASVAQVEQFDEMVQMLHARSTANLPIRDVVLIGWDPLEEEQYERLGQEAPGSVVQCHEFLS